MGHRDIETTRYADYARSAHEAEVVARETAAVEVPR
jgi:hypothetical protein